MTTAAGEVEAGAAVADVAALEVGETPLAPATLEAVRARLARIEGGLSLRELPDPDAAAAGEAVALRIDGGSAAGGTIEELTGEAPPPLARPIAVETAPVPAESEPADVPQDGLVLEGLSIAEAVQRKEAGLVNRGVMRGRTDIEIVLTNTITAFNLLLFGLVGALLALAIVDPGGNHAVDAGVVGLVVFANIIIGTAQELRATRKLRRLVALTAPSSVVIRGGTAYTVRSDEVVQGDLVRLGAGDQVVADGPILHGRAEIDESVLTGETRSVARGPGDELASGAYCTSGSCFYEAERVGAESRAVKETAAARQLRRPETPLQLRFKRMLRVLMLATLALAALLVIQFVIKDVPWGEAIKAVTALVTSVVPDGLLLGFTVAFAVGALRVARMGAIVQDNTAVEALNYVDTICLDKTGTITANRLQVEDARWAGAGRSLRGWLGAFAAASAGDNRTARAVAEEFAPLSNGAAPLEAAPFNSERRYSALRLALAGEQRVFVLGEPERVLSACPDGGRLLDEYNRAAGRGLRGVAFAEAPAMPEAEGELPQMRAVALVTIADELRPEVGNAFRMMEELEISPKIISGDNPETVSALVQQLGTRLEGGLISGPELARMNEAEMREAVERTSVFGRIAPQQKEQLVAALQANGRYVAMVGDGQNDVPALRRADIGVAMESGTNIARSVAGIVLRGDSFEALVRGSGAAQTVLGNCAQLTKLFITKSIYVYLIIFLTSMMGLEFPFLPRHGSVTALLTLGIPAAFIALTTPPKGSGRDFIAESLRFAIPAAITLAIAAVGVYLLTEGLGRSQEEDGRTLVSATVAIVALIYTVQVIGYAGASREAPLRPILVTFFGALLIGVFVLLLYTPALRDRFQFVAMTADQWASVIIASALAIGGKWLLSRDAGRLMGWMSGRAEEDAASRGRAAG